MLTRQYQPITGYARSGDSYTGKDFGSIASSLNKDTIRPFFAIDLMFDNNPLYFWSGLGDLTIGSVTYLGAGNLLNISTMTETTDTQAANATVSLSGISQAMLSVALTTKYHGRIARIKFGMTRMNEAFLLRETSGYILQESGALLSVSSGDSEALTTLFVGYMDQMTIEEGPETSFITMALESKLVDLERPRPIRLTSEGQKIRFPNSSPDKAFEYINSLQDKPVMWGRGVKMKGG
jgi:hypothetical protein